MKPKECAVESIGQKGGGSSQQQRTIKRKKINLERTKLVDEGGMSSGGGEL